MNCEHMKDVDEHLTECAECRKIAETLQAATPPEPRGSWEDLERRLQRKPRVKWIWPAAAAAAAVVAVVLSIPRTEAPPRNYRIQVVDAADRVESSEVDAVLESIEGGPLADANGRSPR